MFNDRLKLLRTEAALTQQQLSDRTGINRSSIAHYEKGIREPNLDTLEIVADYLLIQKYSKKNCRLWQFFY